MREVEGQRGCRASQTLTLACLWAAPVVGLLPAPASQRGIDGLLTIDLLDSSLTKNRFKISQVLLHLCQSTGFDHWSELRGDDVEFHFPRSGEKTNEVPHSRSCALHRLCCFGESLHLLRFSNPELFNGCLDAGAGGPQRRR